EGFPAVRRADAHRPPGPAAAPPGADPRDARLLPAALPAARRLLLRRGAPAGVRRARAREPQAPGLRPRRPDRALPARHPGAGAGPGDHLEDRPLPRPSAGLDPAAGGATPGA